MSEYVTRGEWLSMMRRLDAIDTTGTRGVAVLAVQIQDLAKDFAKHEQQHEREEAQRSSNRKWLFAMAVAVIAAVDGPVVTIVLARGGR